MNYPHDIDLGPKPDARETHVTLANGWESDWMRIVLHYLRDEAAECIGRSTDALRQGQVETASMELGAHEILVQVFTKLDTLRKTPVELEA